MTRSFLKILLMIFVVNLSFAQNATDFTTDDCNGLTHNLFDSLDAGNVVVIAWVMPCGPCATYASYAYDAVQSFNTSHPGKVDFYLVDDFANTTCMSLVNWGSQNGMPLNTTFSSVDISMSDYGTNGMPKVVVLGGNDHIVYYNINNTQINFIDVQNAISNALSPPLNVDNQKNMLGLSCYPNPTNDFLNINYQVNNIEEIIFEVRNRLGQTVFQSNTNESVFLGARKEIIDIRSLESGVYYLRCFSQSISETISFVVVR